MGDESADTRRRSSKTTGERTDVDGRTVQRTDEERGIITQKGMETRKENEQLRQQLAEQNAKEIAEQRKFIATPQQERSTPPTPLSVYSDLSTRVHPKYRNLVEAAERSARKNKEGGKLMSNAYIVEEEIEDDLSIVYPTIEKTYPSFSADLDRMAEQAAGEAIEEGSTRGPIMTRSKRAEADAGRESD